MRNLSFKIISPSELSESMSVNFQRVSHSLGIYEDFSFLPVLCQPAWHSLSVCSLESFKITSSKVTLLWELIGSQ